MYGYFAYGEYLLPCRRLASGRRSAGQMRTHSGYTAGFDRRSDKRPAPHLLGLDSDTFYIYHVAAVMVDNLRRLLLGINLSDKAIMDFDFPGVGFPV